MSIEPPNPAKAWRYSLSYNRLPKRNLFTTLPAELRNQIYELTLASSSTPIEIRPTRRKDPPLLRVSRQIRRESRPIYYCLNTFALTVTLDRLEGLRHWLECIKHTCGEIRGTLCVRRCRARHVGKLLPVARIAYEGMDVASVKTDYRSLEMLGALRAVAGLGAKARKEGLRARMVEVLFDEWMLEWLELRRVVPRAKKKSSEGMGQKNKYLELVRRQARVDVGTDEVVVCDEDAEDVEREEDGPDAREQQQSVDEDEVQGEFEKGRKHPSGWTTIN